MIMSLAGSALTMPSSLLHVGVWQAHCLDLHHHHHHHHHIFVYLEVDKRNRYKVQVNK